MYLVIGKILGKLVEHYPSLLNINFIHNLMWKCSWIKFVKNSEIEHMTRVRAYKRVDDVISEIERGMK